MDEIKLYSPKVMMDILDRYGFKFSKSLGQNFLIDGNIINRIAEIADLDENSGVLEIGPGFGTLTQVLCKKAKKVVAIEVDKGLMEVHKGTLNFPNLKIIYEDFLKVDVNKLIEEEFKGLNVKIVANLPYYITTPIIMKILEEKYKISKIVVMVQKEVAQRLNSKAGTKEYGAITLAVQYRADTNIAMIVPNSVFMPKPKVDSAVIEFNILSKPRIEVLDEDMLFAVIKASFGQRRKTIINGLSNSLNLSKELLNESLVCAGIDPGIRGEKLTLLEFGRIADEISKRTEKRRKLMKIYTKTGDKGQTSLYDGTRVDKDSLRVESYGTIDELNSYIGFAAKFINDERIKEDLKKIQMRLFFVAGELATVEEGKYKYKVKDEDILALEKIIDDYLPKISGVDKFIVPGSSESSASLHVARTICRRAERKIITLKRHEEVSDTLLKFVNRLSDVLYTYARFLESELTIMDFEKAYNEKL